MVSPINRFKLIIIISVIGYRLSVISCYAQASEYVRVAIVQDAESLGLKIRGSYEIVDSKTREVLYQGKNPRTLVTAYKSGITIGSQNFNTPRIFIKTDSSDVITIDNRRFRGNIQFIRKDNLHLLVVNHIDLEDYIKGILYHEASHYWPEEVLKAQAIACRTFALNQMKENKSKDYDVTADIYSQVYGGRTSERYRTNKIVDETKGKVLIYQDRIFPAYYHATCGGHTEDASLLWNIDIMPLKGVPCNFCKDSPHFRWHRVLSEDEIKAKLVSGGYAECSDIGSYSSASRSNATENRCIRDKINNIKDIVILDRDRSGRATDLKITTDTKKDVKISAKDFRNTVGPNIIRSTNFNVEVVNHDVVFEGYGWGHGVGMCQWGAYFMAKKGRTHQEILKYYYPGSKISLIVNR